MSLGPAAIRWCLGDLCVCGSAPGDGKVIHVNIVKENAAEWVALIHLITDSIDPQQQASQSRGRKRDSTPAYIARRRGVMSVCGAFTPIFLGILIFSSFFLCVDCEMLCHWQMSTELKNNVFIDGLQFRIRKIGATEKDRTIKEPNPGWSRWAEDPFHQQPNSIYIYISWSELPPPSSSLHDWLLDWRPFVLLETLKNDLKKKKKKRHRSSSSFCHIAPGSFIFSFPTL